MSISVSAMAGGGCASTVSIETETGWHVVKVEGYSQLKLLGVGERVKSGTFGVGEHCWNIVFFPAGFSLGSADSVSVSLCLDPCTANRNKIRAQFMFSLLDQAGESVCCSDIHTRTFSSAYYREWGYHDIIKRVDLESSSYLKDDSFSIRCDVTVFKDIRAEFKPLDSFNLRVPPPPELHRHLGDLLASEVGGDVTFEVGGETFAAHKYMLAARSSVFKAELFGPMKETAANRVRIDDMEPKVFRAMLYFIYTDMLPEFGIGEDKVVMSQHLLVAADRYNLDRLKLICEDTLAKCINSDIAATTLVLAEQHDCRGLKEACFKFLTRPGNLRAVMAGDGFQHLKISCPSLLEELLAKVAPP